MGAVYLANDTKLDRLVALKLPTLPADQRYLQRFYREAQSVAGLRHAGICPVFDVGDIDGIHHIAMAYIDGITLSEYRRSQRLSPEQILELVRRVGEALSVAHQLGVIHRDLKPSNIIVQP